MINVNLGSGVQNYLGALYARVAQGLGFDVSGNIQIPTYGVGQGLLANSQIIDAARLVDYAVSQMKLQNAQIIDAAHCGSGGSDRENWSAGSGRGADRGYLDHQCKNRKSLCL